MLNIMLVTPAPSVYVHSSCWLLQHTLCISSHHADYSSTLCVCPVIMLITPAHSVYVQSSRWLFQHPLCMSSHHADYSSTLCVCPVITLINPAHSMSSRHADYSHHAQTLLVSHYVRRHVFSVLGSASLNNQIPKVFKYYVEFRWVWRGCVTFST
jgi:hypothetical protein